MSKELEDIFIYKGGSDLPDGSMRLSGSSFSKWVSTPWQFYRETVLGLDKFEGSTSSVLGTAVHLAAECYEKKISHIQDEVFSQLRTYGEENPHLELDLDEIMKQFPLMVNELVDSYLSTAPRTEFVEEDLSIDLGNNLYVQGQVDRREGAMIIDYKSFNSATDPKTMPSYYRQQLLFYAWLYKQSGIHTDRIRLVYISREIDSRYISPKTGNQCGKVTPSRVVVLTEMITDEDIDWVDSMVKLWVDTMTLVRERPEYTHIALHDPRLKQTVQEK